MTVNAGAEVVVVRPRAGADVTGLVLPFEVAPDGTSSDPRMQDADVFRIYVRDVQAGASREEQRAAAQGHRLRPPGPQGLRHRRGQEPRRLHRA